MEKTFTYKLAVPIGNVEELVFHSPTMKNFKFAANLQSLLAKTFMEITALNDGRPKDIAEAADASDEEMTADDYLGVFKISSHTPDMLEAFVEAIREDGICHHSGTPITKTISDDIAYADLVGALAGYIAAFITPS